MLVAEIDDNPQYPNKIKIPQTEYRFKELLAALPSSRWDKDDEYWHINLTWQTCLALKNDLKQHVEAGPKLLAWMDEEYQKRILPSFLLRDKIEAEGYERLYPHQRGDVAFLTTARRGFLANGMGSGKSQSAFSAVRRLHELGEKAFPVLIACPNSTKFAWKREIEDVFPGLTVSVVDGTSTKRRKALQEKAHVFILNWESLRYHSRLKPYGSHAAKKCVQHGGLDPKITDSACELHPKELNDIDFATVIGDEIHRIKDPSSKVSRAFKAATGDAEFRFGLSGTPIASAPDDLFSPLNWMFPDAYPSKTKYIDRFCIKTINNWGAETVIGIHENMKKEFFDGIDPFLRRMPKELILPFLPPIIHERRDVEMAAKQKKAYEQMQAKMIAELDDELLVVKSALTKMMRSLQFSSSYAEVEYREVLDKDTGELVNKAFVTLSDPSCKLDAFMDDLPDYGDESIVVFAVSKQLIMMLSARLDKAKIPHGLITGDQDAVERQAHMDNFQRGETKLILSTIAAGGTGITLTNGSTAVFLQRSWSMIENQQAEARVHRIGSEKYESIRILDYVTTGTSEEIVFQAVEEKGRQLEFILRDKELMKKYLKAEEIVIPEGTEIFELIQETISEDGDE